LTRQTQNLLYHLLPAVLGLLAAGAIVLWVFLSPAPFRIGSLTPAFLSLVAAAILRHIERHGSSQEQCFQVALMMGVSSYWLPTVVFLTIPVWAYLIYRNLFNSRSFFATLLGYGVVAAWASVAVYMDWIDNPWAEFWTTKNAYGWIPTGVLLVTYIVSTIVRQTLRAR